MVLSGGTRAPMTKPLAATPAPMPKVVAPPRPVAPPPAKADRPGKKDGLYWPAAPGEQPSPLGEFAAQASAEGYKAGKAPIPYHGYYYRILTRQGAGSPGGAYDYLVNGKMRGGFALVAFPAEYGNSGIKTFMVNHDGSVFEKDLGPKTAKLARRIDSFAPDQSWAKVDSSQ